MACNVLFRYPDKSAFCCLQARKPIYVMTKTCFMNDNDENDDNLKILNSASQAIIHRAPRLPRPQEAAPRHRPRTVWT